MWKFFKSDGSEKKTTILSIWQTGDYKISAQEVNHVDPAGGTWYLCDGGVTVGASLIALVGANLPDARGRDLVMKGTHVNVNVIGDSDGVATVADRNPKHKHTVVQPTVAAHDHGGGVHSHGVTDPQHSHTQGWNDFTGSQATGLANCASSAQRSSTIGSSLTGISVNASGATVGSQAPATSGGTVGPQTAGTPIDAGSFIVPGNLFVHS